MLISEGSPPVLRGRYSAGASLTGPSSGTQSPPAFLALVNFTAAYRSEAATSSASISTTVRLDPSSASQVWLWIGAR